MTGRPAAATPVRRAHARTVLGRLSKVFPGADTELHFGNAFELLVATILSAQSTDKRVNQVTPALFARYPDARRAGSRRRARPRAAHPVDGVLPREDARRCSARRDA